MYIHIIHTILYIHCYNTISNDIYIQYSYKLLQMSRAGPPA